MPTTTPTVSRQLTGTAERTVQENAVVKQGRFHEQGKSADVLLTARMSAVFLSVRAQTGHVLTPQQNGVGLQSSVLPAANNLFMNGQVVKEAHLDRYHVRVVVFQAGCWRAITFFIQN